MSKYLLVPIQQRLLIVLINVRMLVLCLVRKMEQLITMVVEAQSVEVQHHIAVKVNALNVPIMFIVRLGSIV